jgi:phospholipase C
MTTTDRRDFLRLVGGATLATAFSQSIERALAIPASQATGTINDIEHIVVLTQENRSFDHYFGTMRGVRGFGDPRPVLLPNGKPVWRQPDGAGEVLPFRPDARPLGDKFLDGTPHNWPDSHQAWNNGKYDQWVPAKGRHTMAHLSRNDIPFHFALAEAFTICDAYHCSVMGATDPNRYYMWTGWVGNDGLNGGPVVDNSEAGYDWRTYPELLEQAGVSWKIYQDEGAGLDAAHWWGWGENPYIGNYGDNSLLYFHQYQNAQPGSPLFEKARRGTNISARGNLFEILRNDVLHDKLPQVSWIAAPEAYTEHSNWPSNFGAWYISKVLDALTANPNVWSKTALLINYDENDGFFDHVVPPTAPATSAQGRSTVPTTHEIYPGGATYAPGPYGLGSRVPMIVVSPWSKGGYVCSELFDHTSVLRFIEKRFGVAEPQISPWRKAICGDLTSAFDFSKSFTGVVFLPSTTGFGPRDRERHPTYTPAPPANQAVPKQEPGLRYARPLPYELDVKGALTADRASFKFDFVNTGKAAAWFHVRSAQASAGPWSYTVEAGKSLVAGLRFPTSKDYAFTVHGPNGFFRRFKGGAEASRATLEVSAKYVTQPEVGIELTIVNRGLGPVSMSVVDAYGSTGAFRKLLSPAERVVKLWRLGASHGWYDLSISVASDRGFSRRLAGHVENGKVSTSDPAFGQTGFPAIA